MSDILTAEKLAEIEARLRDLSRVHGHNGYTVGHFLINAAMIDAADALKAQAAEIERLETAPTESVE